MKSYIPNSPEAMARVVAMMIVTDAHVDTRELAVLDNLKAYEALGMTREDFMRVSRDYCSQLVEEAEDSGDVPLVDPSRADAVIDCVEVTQKRLIVAKLLLAVLNADLEHDEFELILFEHVLDRWSLTRDDVLSAKL
jgi:hypothetical protein